MGKGGAHDMTSSRTGQQQDYLQGLDHLRTQISSMELEVDKVKREFYNCDTNIDDQYEAYLKACNDKLLYCNNKLRKAHKKLDVIDGELKLVELLNKMRSLTEHDTIDPAVISFLTEFWENIKNSMEAMKLLGAKYRTTVFKRLKSSCQSYRENSYGKDISLTSQYNEQVSKMEGEIEQLLQLLDQLLKSFEKGVNQELFTNTNFSDRILVSCDRKAFPILRVVPDLSEKLSRCCTIANQWINKDETYVHDIHNHIRETRTQARKKENALRTQKERQEELNRSVDEAYSLFKSNKNKLGQLETELKTLEEQLAQYDAAKKYKTEEKKTKEGIVGFLEISITQTKKNFTLQLKRSRLMRQLRELEESLKMIEDEIQSMEGEIRETNGQRQLVETRVKQSNESYQTLKTDLDEFNKKIDALSKEVGELTDSLTHLEIIQSFKTCPEKIEDFYDQPAKVQLAPSLKEKILQRKRKLNAHRSKRT